MFSLLVAALICIQLIHAYETRITLPPEDQRVTERGPAAFYCRASGSPSIIWRRNGRQLQSGRGRYVTVDVPGGSILRLESIRVLPSWNDTYTCAATGVAGETAEASAQLVVFHKGTEPDGFPEIVEHGVGAKAVEDGHSTVLTCKASGTPAPSIMWLKDYIPVDTTLTQFKQLPEGHLQIEGAQESDEGSYECVAENSAGTVYSDVTRLYVKVRRSPPKFVEEPADIIQVYTGDRIEIACSAVGKPQPYVYWKAENEPLSLPEISKSKLILNDIKVSIEYTCVAENKYGMIEKMTKVMVQGKPIG